MNNTQFATAIHILTLLAITGESLSSVYIAGSINANPAIVRKLISILSSQGLVLTREGKGGGTSIARAANKIFLSEIYLAVSDSRLLGKMNDPNPDCKTGKQINRHLRQLFDQVDALFIDNLGKMKLSDFTKKFK